MRHFCATTYLHSTVPTFPGGMETYISPVFCIQKRIRMGIHIVWLSWTRNRIRNGNADTDREHSLTRIIWIRIGLAPWIRFPIEIKSWIRNQIRIETNKDNSLRLPGCGKGPGPNPNTAKAWIRISVRPSAVLKRCFCTCN